MKDTQNLLLNKITSEGIERFLSSDFVDGIGPAYAHRLVDAFGKETLQVLKDTPEKCSEIKGLGEARGLRLLKVLMASNTPYLFSLFYSHVAIVRYEGVFRL